MRNCPVCQRDLEQAAIVQGKCPHCGAILRKLSQRTFDNKRLPTAGVKKRSPEEADEFDLDELLKSEQTDTDPGSHTIEISDVTLDDEPAVDAEDMTPLDDDKSLADLAADVRARDEADEFILGDSIDLDLVDDDTHIGQTIEISDVVLDSDKLGLDVDDMTPLEDERQPFKTAEGADEDI